MNLEKNNSHKYIWLVFWLVITFAVSFVASRFMPGEWYQSLNKPSWNPPNWVFGPVWTYLYATMAIAVWMVWEKRSDINVKPAVILYIIQLLINGIWSFVFFGQEMIGLALVDILLLLVIILFTLRIFLKINKTAGNLLIPYLIWVSFATVLNFSLWILN